MSKDDGKVRIGGDLRVFRDSLVSKREGVLSLVRVDEDTVEEVNDDDNDLSEGHPAKEVLWSPHL